MCTASRRAPSMIWCAPWGEEGEWACRWQDHPTNAAFRRARCRGSAKRSTSGCRPFSPARSRGDGTRQRARTGGASQARLWLDATYLKVREGGRIVSLAVIVAVGVNLDGRREVLGIATGPSEAETFWTDFLRSLADRGLRGVRLVIADDHKGLRAAARRVFDATQQRCRVHWTRNTLAHVGARNRAPVAAMLKTIFA